MIDLDHPLAVLSSRLPWEEIEAALPADSYRQGWGSDLFGASSMNAEDGPQLSVRLMVALFYLKHTFSLSDREVVEQWPENVVWQYFSGQEYYTSKPPCSATQIGRFRALIGKAGVELLLEAILGVDAFHPGGSRRVAAGIDVRKKATDMLFDKRLLERVRNKVVTVARTLGGRLKRGFTQKGGILSRRTEAYAHTRKDKRLRRALWRKHAILGSLLHEMSNNIQLERQTRLLHAVNSAASVLLTVNDEGRFQASLREGMELMARCMDVDRINIWRNEARDEGLHYVLQYAWLSDTGRQEKHVRTGEGFSYTPVKGWESDPFSRGEYTNSLVADLSPAEQEMLTPYGIKSILVIPVHFRESFWGFVSFDDCHQERTFTEEEVSILHSASLMMVSAISRNAQTVNIREAYERTDIMLNAMPASGTLWNRDLRIFECNEEAVKFFKLRDKKECLERFFDFSPEFQPDGRTSREKVFAIIKKAFDQEGKHVLEWTHCLSDGTLIPSEVTLIRVRYGDGYAVAGYTRDLSEHKKMMAEIERQDRLLNTVSRMATALLQAEIDGFEDVLWYCMSIMAGTVDVDRVSVWKNREIEGERHSYRLYEWMEGAEPQHGDGYADAVRYSDVVPGWEERMEHGQSINGIVRNMSAEERAWLSRRGTLSVLVIPVFLRGQFWGLVSFNDCHCERIFSKSEESILHSAVLLIAHALLRNDMTLSIRAAAARLEAIITNYSGIIWSVDQNNVITLFNGLHLDDFGNSSAFFEGNKLDAVLDKSGDLNIPENVQKTFVDGPQDWISRINARVYHLRTMPIYDDDYNVTNVVGSADDITEIVRLQAELEVALKETQKANNAKSDFLAKMSHEMRTPLNAIIGFSELTLASDVLSDGVHTNLEKIHSAAMTLLSTVNDILDISRIEAGKLHLVPIEYDIPSLLNDSITQSISHIGEKPIQFVLDVDERLPARLYGDDLRLKQVLNNLLSNAFKYTNEGTVELEVRSVQEGDTVWVTARVRDTGIGIRPEDMHTLFEDYARMDIESNREIEGTGLGLPITRKILDMMEGSLSVESAYGKGSVFTIRFPQKFVSEETIGPEVASSLRHFRYSDRKRRMGYLRRTRIRLPYARVLVVDDIAANLDIAKGMMRPYGMQVDCVNSGQKAIDAVRKESVRYNAIFMDHMMPVMDGIEATRRIREEIGTEYARTVPIIAFTANAIVGNEQLFLSSGFQAFISKPIEMARLDAVIHKWVRNKELERTLDASQSSAGEQPDIRAERGKRAVPEKKGKTISRSLRGKIAGLDIARGLKYFDDDEESFLRVLRSYTTNTLPLVDALKKVDKDNLADYAITIHGIKGSSRGICADKVANEAEPLEKAAKAGDLDFVCANNLAFIESISTLLAGLEEMFGKIAARNPKPKKSEPDMKMLRRLLFACRDYDVDVIDATMAEVENCEYDSDDGITAWLRENVDRMNYAQIVERLSPLMTETREQNG